MTIGKAVLGISALAFIAYGLPGLISPAIPTGLAGLAITRLLHTMAMQIRSHERVVFHWSAALWAFSIMLYILQLWWVGWGLRNIVHWTFLDFIVLVFGSFCIYGAAEMTPSAPDDDILDMLEDSQHLRRLSAGSMR